MDNPATDELPTGQAIINADLLVGVPLTIRVFLKTEASQVLTTKQFKVKQVAPGIIHVIVNPKGER